MSASEARVRAALELRELMIAMRREALTREHPGESPEQIAERLREWVLRPVPVGRGSRERASTRAHSRAAEGLASELARLVGSPG